MKARSMWSTALAAAALAVGPAPAADFGRGEMLVKNHCRSCHTSGVHTRAERKGTSPEDVRAQILRWQSHLGLGWGPEEVGDVLHYLDVRFYRFEAASPGGPEAPRSRG